MENVFSHTTGAWALGAISHVINQLLFLLAAIRLQLSTRSVFLYHFSTKNLVFSVGNMSTSKNTSKSRSRVVKRLQSHNKSPENQRSSRSSSSHHSRSRSRSPVAERERSSQPRTSQSSSETPEWAKELLKQQKEYGKEIKRLKAELDGRSKKAGKHDEKEPEFKFEGNKKQYKLNKKVLEKISSAKETSDDELRAEFLKEGEDLLFERNKHICIAEKYGWDTVECYSTDPIASDSDDEKKIKRAVKESKLLREEKRKAKLAKSKRPTPQQGVERRVVIEKSAAASTAGKMPNVKVSRDTGQCFRCFRYGHIARDCRAPVGSSTTGQSQSSG